MGEKSDQVTIEIPPTLHRFVDGALLRLQSQYPNLDFRASSTGVQVAPAAALDLNDLRKQISYAVYREKIYVETLPLRRSLIEAVTSR
ncbi:hypothetical protein EN817_20865 [Mesorhizobium sp. M3A.F.Ca.ET.174.01.1.1]|uniref:hypothetical protein n=1 Tax=unclassified Mesorhizobium TaxID=325217 RepID=UPI001093864E|nr:MULTISPECIES: hypothetical protein [unclassified Mesorhizobium]TGS85763.1 hypothetical protein EN818_17475 [Mesorhizobium sp. M3A.F.Ca.ET.175.01.1.1]TGT23927.1 hypothetical protein EN817_20865 [Mesorhizobium sp. M3A.F.Ca.ET.174.01.1.1]